MPAFVAPMTRHPAIKRIEPEGGIGTNPATLTLITPVFVPLQALLVQVAVKVECRNLPARKK